jgi:hypothetical protein
MGRGSLFFSGTLSIPTLCPFLQGHKRHDLKSTNQRSNRDEDKEVNRSRITITFWLLAGTWQGCGGKYLPVAAPRDCLAFSQCGEHSGEHLKKYKIETEAAHFLRLRSRNMQRITFGQVSTEGLQGMGEHRLQFPEAGPLENSGVMT